MLSVVLTDVFSFYGDVPLAQLLAGAVSACVVGSQQEDPSNGTLSMNRKASICIVA